MRDSENVVRYDSASGARPLVHPELLPCVAMLEQMDREFGPPGLDSLATVRQTLAGVPPLESPAWYETAVPVPGGADVQVLVINAQPGRAPRPAILHIHGGGFVAGSARATLPRLQGMAAALDCVAVSVEYRLAPETPYPGALEDNHAALTWLYRQSSELGVDPTQIALLGESAGGGHAAMLAIAARDRGEVPIAFQALIYPMLDDRTGSSRAVPPHIGRLLWTPAHNRFGWSSLLGWPVGSRPPPPGAVPARVADLSGLPPTFIAVGALDLFVQEDIEYAARLIDAGVPTELLVIPGAFHAFDAIAPDAEVSRGLATQLNRALADAWQQRR